MKQAMLVGVGAGLLVGFLIGYIVGSSGSSSPVPTVAAVPTSTAPPGPSPFSFALNAAAAPNAQAIQAAQARILGNLQVVASEPGNLEAWKQLGNDYFDTNQAQNAVDAYAKALALEPGNADILTDQGIMYRQLKAYDKAIGNFERAAKANPRHLKSQFNLGIVYAQDLKQKDKAIKIWKRIIELAPGDPQADQARAAIAEVSPH